MNGLEPHDVPDGVDPTGWALRVSGTVERPLRLDREDLGRFPTETFTQDFECVEGWTAADLSWRGVRVGDVLERAEPTAESAHAVVHGMDGDYACAFPIDRITDAVIAVELDGTALPVEHGGPARFVPTGGESDCWESVKWVAEIRLTETVPTGADTAKAIALGRAE